jgi:hypothetical protein
MSPSISPHAIGHTASTRAWRPASAKVRPAPVVTNQRSAFALSTSSDESRRMSPFDLPNPPIANVVPTGEGAYALGSNSWAPAVEARASRHAAKLFMRDPLPEAPVAVCLDYYFATARQS